MAEAPVTSSRDRAQLARREALLEAAEHVFAERGYAQATMAEIAERAGYSAGNLYNFFASKEALFREVVAWRGQVLLARLEAALDGPGRLLARFDALLDALVAFVAEHRPFFVIYVQTTSGFGWHLERLGEGVLAMQERLESRVVQALERAMAKGEIEREEPLAAAHVLLGAMNRCLTRWIQRDEDVQALHSGAAALRRVLHRALVTVSPARETRP